MKVGNATIAQSDAMGAWPQLYAATMPDVQGNDYYGPHLLELRGHPKKVDRAAKAKNADDANRLWDLSEELTKVHYDHCADPAASVEGARLRVAVGPGLVIPCAW